MNVPLCNERSIVLTGATGFVGAVLLARLLERDTRPVICLVRAGTTEDAMRRGRSALADALGRRLTTRETARVKWVRGDIEIENLGLPRPVYTALAHSTAEIYHCAASTRFDLPLAEARRINCRGVQTMHRFATEAVRHGGFRRFHHVSTAYVAGTFAGTRSACDVVMRNRRFRNTYERTKAEAERFLLQSGEMPITVYRPSIIVGDSRTGRTTSWNVIYYPMRLMAAGVFPYGPGPGRGLLDCVPVDYVVDAMLALGARDDTLGGVFHLTAGKDALTCSDIVTHTYRGIARHRGTSMRVDTRLLGRVQWWLFTALQNLTGPATVKKVLRRIQSYVPYTRVRGIFDNEREAAMLAAAGVHLPPARDFFPNIVRYALVHEFGRKTDTPAETPNTVPKLTLVRSAPASPIYGEDAQAARSTGRGTLRSN